MDYKDILALIDTVVEIYVKKNLSKPGAVLVGQEEYRALYTAALIKEDKNFFVQKDSYEYTHLRYNGNLIYCKELPGVELQLTLKDLQ